MLKEWSIKVAAEEERKRAGDNLHLVQEIIAGTNECRNMLHRRQFLCRNDLQVLDIRGDDKCRELKWKGPKVQLLTGTKPYIYWVYLILPYITLPDLMLHLLLCIILCLWYMLLNTDIVAAFALGKQPSWPGIALFLQNACIFFGYVP